jgi:purine-binding chemotaxis protein CheW
MPIASVTADKDPRYAEATAGEEGFGRSSMDSTVLERKQAAAIRSDDRGGKYLVFELGREEFGIRVLKVREIMGIQHITAVPQAPQHVKGVINLRGKVIPVVDLRLKFDPPEQEYTADLHNCGPGARRGGAPVDGHGGGQRGRGTQPGGHRHRRYAGLRRWNGHARSVGHGKGKGKVKILLEIDRVLTSGDLHALDDLMQEVERRGKGIRTCNSK